MIYWKIDADFGISFSLLSLAFDLNSGQQHCLLLREHSVHQAMYYLLHSVLFTSWKHFHELDDVILIGQSAELLREVK